MRILGIDYGTKRVGVALSDEGKQFAMPYQVLQNNDSLMQELAHIVSKETVERVVIGESRDLMGVKNPVQGDIQIFSEKVTEDLKLPVVFEPEFFTSAQAVRQQGTHDKLDASAAALILQSYLDKQYGKH